MAGLRRRVEGRVEMKVFIVILFNDYEPFEIKHVSTNLYGAEEYIRTFDNIDYDCAGETYKYKHAMIEMWKDGMFVSSITYTALKEEPFNYEY